MAKLRSVDFAKHIPSSWLGVMGGCKIYVSGFRVLMPESQKLPSGHVIELNSEIRILLWFGEVLHTLQSPLMARQGKDGSTRFQGNVLAQEVTDRRENWLIIIKRLSNDAEINAEDDATSLAGFVAAVAGPAWVYERIFGSYILLPSGNRQGKIPSFFVNKFESTPTDTSKQRIAHIGNLLSSYARIESAERKGIELACHWYDLGFRASGLDAFIYSWVAIEMLSADPKINDTKIAIENTLLRIYNLDKEEAVRLMIGRLFGYRSRIFHEGIRPRSDGWLTAYLQAIFVDVLFHRLKLPNSNQALLILDGYAESIKAELTAAQK